MSRSSHSGRHRSSLSRNTDTSNEDLVEQVKTIITTLDNVVSNYADRIESYIPSAQSAMAVLDRIRFFREPNRLPEQIWIIQGLQDFAYHDADSGCIRDVAEWSQSAWLKVLRIHPENSQILMGMYMIYSLALVPSNSVRVWLTRIVVLGLGGNWLQRAQAVLSKIQTEESNQQTNGSSQSSEPQLTSSELGNEIIADYEPPTDGRRQRIESANYVEARGYLQPAVDFYTRAVRAADSENSMTGDLLASAAEAQMSLGNVTGSPRDERYFSQAIRYLRRAEAIPNYTLSIYLQNYLDEYGRYVS
ncbi:hypothetical protein BP6252_02598 [Coleophoma cylindrospora]|uniref:Uncharacterized protein n=1 Tax=Coleophoma cylindrospora TaxID=1849047 RepID=A0A3D8SGX5_9HELO|nr:hypothetical protein BP6252_02598 [Coleophoma cylindrospora]